MNGYELRYLAEQDEKPIVNCGLCGPTDVTYYCEKCTKLMKPEKDDFKAPSMGPDVVATDTRK